MTLRLLWPCVLTLVGGVASAAIRGSFADSRTGRSYRTLVIDLERGIDAVRTELHAKWRYELKRAEKQGLDVAWTSTADDFEVFAAMLGDLEERKGFESGLDVALAKRLVVDADNDDATFELALVRAGTDPVAGVVIGRTPTTATYLLGAATPRGRELRASYLAQWSALSRACVFGAKYYDLGGIDPHFNPGVYQFKARMGGVDVVAPGPFDMAAAGPIGAMSGLAERVYRSLRRR